MNIKKILVGMITVMTLGVELALPVAAQSATPTPTKETRREIRQDLKAVRQANKGKFTHFINAVVTANSGTSLTVSYNGKSITVNTTSNTQLRRHFWGSSTLSEISVNDKVNVWGVWADDAQTTITASLIRDVSIMKRREVFFGTVSSLNSSGFVLASMNRGNQTVTVSSSTKYINRKGAAITFADVKTGDRVRINGMWDNVNNTVTEISQVKDFSNPVATTSPTPTP